MARWTKEEVTKLEELTNKEYTDKEIGQMLTKQFGHRRSKSAVETKRLSLGFYKAKNTTNKKTNQTVTWTEKEIEKLKELTNEGYTDEEIGQMLTKQFEHKRSKSAIESKRLNLKIKKQNHSQEKSNSKYNMNSLYNDTIIEKDEQHNVEWSHKNILALKYLNYKGLDPNTIAKIIGGDKTKEAVKSKLKTLA